MTPHPGRPLPRRRDGLLAREVGEDVVVLDPTTDEAHALTGAAAAAWRAVDARQVPTGLSDEALADALMELELAGLLEAEGTTRRSVLRRGATIAALTGVATIALPEAAAFASTNIATVLTLTPANQYPATNATQTLTATVTRQVGGAPVSGVTVTFKNGATTLGSGTTDSSGNVSLTLTTLPATGDYTVTATSTATSTYTSSTNSITYHVGRYIVLTPASGLRGSSVTINAYGFAPTHALTVTFGGTPVTVTGGTTDGHGAATMTFTVPAGAATGSNNVVVSDTTNTASATYSVTSAPTITTVSPSTLPHGGAVTSVTVNGTDFVATPTVTVSDSNFVVQSVTFVSSTQLTVSIKNNYGNNGNHNSDLTVTNADGGTATKTNAISN